MSLARILVVDDEEIARENLGHILGKAGHEVVLAGSGEEAVEFLRASEFDLVMTDLRMKGISGMDVLAESRRLWPDGEVIVVTGYASVETAVEAMRQGAYHYVSKPFKMDEIRAVVDKALEKRFLKKEIAELRRRVADQTGSHRIIGRNPKILALRETIAQVAQLDCNVLIQGETGTGKELVARTIHDLSPRAGMKFVAFNCGAFTEELITNELFGHEKDSYTGAGKTKKGLLETADGGTAFFDEIGELPLSMQVKLLRTLQERTIMRVGGVRELPVDIRILAATNKDLKKEAEQGAFRLDLFYRLDVITIHIPPLSERRDDIPLLAAHFLAKHAGERGRELRLSPEVVERLTRYEYPGNIRELENIIQRALIMCEGDVIEPRHLLADLREESVLPMRRVGHGWPSLEEHEKNYILEVLDEVEGNKSKAARMLGIDRVSLWRKIKRYGLEDPDASTEEESGR
jgi:DNA-binding NtrC family response regulator